MKIMINYDLMDKVSEAKNGYSLKRCSKRIMGCFGISAPISTVINFAGGSDPRNLFWIYPMHLMIHTSTTLSCTILLMPIMKKLAESNLTSLVPELKNIRVNVNYDALLNAYVYKTEYNLCKDDTAHGIEQKKYIKLPMYDEFFGDRELPIIQEHQVGTNKYSLSFGTPEEKEKVYLLNRQFQR